MVSQACQRPPKKGNGGEGDSTVATVTETPTTGHVRIGIDESFEPVLHQWVDAFHASYLDADVEVWYKPEAALMRDLLADSLRLAIVGRDWRDQERALIRKATITPRTTQLGTDAITMVVHPDNPIDSISFEQLQRLLRGELTDWSGLHAVAKLESEPRMDPPFKGPIALTFDHPESGVISYIQDHLLPKGAKLPANAYSAGSHDSVIDYVSRSKTALGFVGGAWLADRDHARVKGYLQRVKVMRMISPDTADLPGVAVEPYQNEIALARYPLRRGIYALSREHFNGLGTGFVAFAASERGQRILLKAGLLPEFMPPRFIILPEKEEDSKE